MIGQSAATLTVEAEQAIYGTDYGCQLGDLG